MQVSKSPISFRIFEHLYERKCFSEDRHPEARNDWQERRSDISTPHHQIREWMLASVSLERKANHLGLPDNRGPISALSEQPVTIEASSCWTYRPLNYKTFFDLLSNSVATLANLPHSYYPPSFPLPSSNLLHLWSLSLSQHIRSQLLVCMERQKIVQSVSPWQLLIVSLCAMHSFHSITLWYLADTYFLLLQC